MIPIDKLSIGDRVKFDNYEYTIRGIDTITGYVKFDERQGYWLVKHISRIPITADNFAQTDGIVWFEKENKCWKINRDYDMGYIDIYIPLIKEKQAFLDRLCIMLSGEKVKPAENTEPYIDNKPIVTHPDNGVSIVLNRQDITISTHPNGYAVHRNDVHYSGLSIADLLDRICIMLSGEALNAKAD